MVFASPCRGQKNKTRREWTNLFCFVCLLVSNVLADSANAAVNDHSKYYGFKDAFQNLENHLDFLHCPLESGGFPPTVNIDFFLNMRHTVSYDLPSQTIRLSHPFDHEPAIVQFRIRNCTVHVRNRQIDTNRDRVHKEHGKLPRVVYLEKPPLNVGDQRAFDIVAGSPGISLVPFTDGTIRPTTDSATNEMVRQRDLSTYQERDLFNRISTYVNSHYELGYDASTRTVYSYASGLFGTFVLKEPIDRSRPRWPIAWFAHRNAASHQVIQTKNWVIVPSVRLNVNLIQMIPKQEIDLKGEEGTAPWFLVSKRRPHRRIVVEGPANYFVQHWSNCFEIDADHIQCTTPEGTCQGSPPWDLGDLVAGRGEQFRHICESVCIVNLPNKRVSCTDAPDRTAVVLPTIDPRFRGSTHTVKWGLSNSFISTSEIQSGIVRETNDGVQRMTDIGLIMDEVKMVPTGEDEGEGVLLSIGTSKTDPNDHWLCVLDATSLDLLGRYKIPIALNFYIHGIVVDAKGDFS